MQVVLTYSGVVQGVGFRPTVYRLATELGLLGCVYNDLHGVVVELDGSTEAVGLFRQQLPLQLPLIARIDRHSCWEALSSRQYTDFQVMPSESVKQTNNRVVIPADLRICKDCLTELNEPSDRRYRYPFTNCTNCGPRYSITRSLPYDRCNTTMVTFPMCADCDSEYHDPANRRYHAQPIACPQCGPHIELHKPDRELIASHEEAIFTVQRMLAEGFIIALKGLGGYQLICRADDRDVVAKLRLRKRREAKPFAVMVKHFNEAHHAAIINDREAALLKSHVAPIVLLTRREKSDLAHNVCADSPCIGLMLPTTPLHQLIVQSLPFPIICTSANISDEPICIDDNEAYQRLGGIADYFLTHNRPILRHLDDSVAFVVEDHIIWMRSARGVAPIAVESPLWKIPLIGLGSHMKNSLTIVNPPRSISTQYLGDMDTVASRDAQRSELDRLLELYPIDGKALTVGDLHPDYYVAFPPDIRVQHHHAHVASVVAENKSSLPVLGFCWDATGYGYDNTIWGGEALELTADLTLRRAFYRSYPLLGGDQAAKQTWRPLIGMMSELEPNGSDPVQYSKYAGISEPQANVLVQAIRSGNPARCCSVGRLFDAVGCLLKIHQGNRFEGDTPMQLQLLAEQQTKIVSLPVSIIEHSTSLAWNICGEQHQEPVQSYEIDWAPMLVSLMHLSETSMPIAVLARSFHQWLVNCLLEIASHFSHNEVVLSGGCFQNRLLTELSINALRTIDKTATLPINHPINDGGVALGQCAAVALSNLPHKE